MAKDNAVIIKRDTKENWQKSKYIPKQNVIIIMDNSDGTVSLMIGDGITNVNLLPDLLKSKATLDGAVVDEDILIL